jgi:hypothetical protein
MTIPAYHRLVVSSIAFRKAALLFAIIGLLAFCPAGPLQAQDANHSPGWVVISVPEYRALRVKAYPTEREPEPPPVDATLTRVDYDLRVDTDLASGRATLTVDVLRTAGSASPFPPAYSSAKQSSTANLSPSLRPPPEKTPLSSPRFSPIPAAP